MRATHVAMHAKLYGYSTGVAGVDGHRTDDWFWRSASIRKLNIRRLAEVEYLVTAIGNRQGHCRQFGA